MSTVLQCLWHIFAWKADPERSIGVKPNCFTLSKSELHFVSICVIFITGIKENMSLFGNIDTAGQDHMPRELYIQKRIILETVQMYMYTSVWVILRACTSMDVWPCWSNYIIPGHLQFSCIWTENTRKIHFTCHLSDQRL